MKIEELTSSIRTNKKRLLFISLLISVLIVFALVYFLISKIYYSPRMLIVPHQNAVNELRSELMQEISSTNPFIRTVIIIGPDHFGQTKNEISYTSRDWTLSESNVNFDSDAKVSKEIQNKYGNNDRLKNDHAIYNLLAPISKNFPSAKVVPILIGEKVELEKLSELIQILDKNCGIQCVIVYSVDFSHYLPYPIADVHDLYSIKTLQNNDSADANKLEVDSQQSLYIAMELAKKWRLSFDLFANTNSAKLVGNASAESTSHVLGYYSRGKNAVGVNIKTFIYATQVGDILKNLNARYFYGAESVNTNLDESKKVRDSLEIIPSKDTHLQIQCMDGKYFILLPSDILLTGYAKDKSIHVIFAPQINDIEMFKRCATYDKSTHTFVLD